MTILAGPQKQLQTVSDLLEDLGDIPPARVLIKPAPGTATVADVIAVRDRTRRLCELVDGMLRLFPDLVRIPDVAYISWDPILDGRVPVEPIPNLAPSLAVEVLSRSNTLKEMRRKCKEYFAAGVELVWIFDPEARTVDIFTGPEAFVRLQETDMLDGGAVLAGFSIPLSNCSAFSTAARPGAFELPRPYRYDRPFRCMFRLRQIRWGWGCRPRRCGPRSRRSAI